MTSLLPVSSEPFEVAIEATHAGRWQAMNDSVRAITTSKENPPPSFLPFLVYEFGLGMLTPYVDNVYDVLTEGVKWFRIRGTYGGLKKGLSFIGVTATPEPAWHGRTWWNSCQLRFPELPANDNPLLPRIEGITRLSLPFRSDLRRGVHGYDIQPLEADTTRLDESHLDEESGIRLSAGGTVWSFGRTTEFRHTLSEDEGTSIGNWIEPPDQTGTPWVTMSYLWATAAVKWSDNPDSQRRSLMAAWFTTRTLWATFRDEDGEVIGHRRCRAVKAVDFQVTGAYAFEDERYQPIAAGRSVYIEALTDFDDADGVTAATVEITVGAELADGVKPGRLWLDPDELVGGIAIASQTLGFALRRTVRDRVKWLLDFDAQARPWLNFTRASTTQYLPLLAQELEWTLTLSLSFNLAQNTQFLPLIVEE